MSHANSDSEVRVPGKLAFSLGAATALASTSTVVNSATASTLQPVK